MLCKKVELFKLILKYWENDIVTMKDHEYVKRYLHFVTLTEKQRMIVYKVVAKITTTYEFLCNIFIKKFDGSEENKHSYFYNPKVYKDDFSKEYKKMNKLKDSVYKRFCEKY